MSGPLPDVVARAWQAQRLGLPREPWWPPTVFCEFCGDVITQDRDGVWLDGWGWDWCTGDSDGFNEDGVHAPIPAPHPVRPVCRIVARFGGHCAGCDLPIMPGEVVVKLSDGRSLHEGCD